MYKYSQLELLDEGIWGGLWKATKTLGAAAFPKSTSVIKGAVEKGKEIGRAFRDTKKVIADDLLKQGYFGRENDDPDNPTRPVVKDYKYGGNWVYLAIAYEPQLDVDATGDIISTGNAERLAFIYDKTGNLIRKFDKRLTNTNTPPATPPATPPSPSPGLPPSPAIRP